MAYKDPVKQRAFQRKWQLKQRAVRRAKVIEMLGSKCAHCGYNDNPRAFELDHIVPLKERTTLDQGSNLWRRVYNGDISMGVVQLLCCNCHAIKSYGEIYGPERY